MIWVTESVNLYYLISIIKGIKLNMLEQIVSGPRLLKSYIWVFYFSNESPQWKIIVVHLEVKVIDNSIPEFGNFVSCQSFLTQSLFSLDFLKFQTVQSVGETITSQSFTQRCPLWNYLTCTNNLYKVNCKLQGKISLEVSNWMNIV